MKKLSIEEKAKAYDEAKSIMEKYLKSSNAGVIAENTIKKAFPELIESEDERIRKALVRFHKSTIDIDGIKGEDILAWLERQGENKEINEVSYRIGIKRVLDNPESYGLEKQGEQKPVEWHREDEQNLNACLGYIPDEFLRRWLQDIIHTKYDKTAWSEGDEKQARQIERIVHNDGCSKKLQEQIANWFKFLKYRVQPQPKWEWSEEDEEEANYIADFIENLLKKEKLVSKRTMIMEEMVTWLRDIKYHYLPKPKQSWSEEDYNEIETIACHLDNTDNESMADVLRNIRDKYYHIIPQPTWKPSDNQMDALDYYANSLCTYSDRQGDLRSLFIDLKKLKKE